MGAEAPPAGRPRRPPDPHSVSSRCRLLEPGSRARLRGPGTCAVGFRRRRINSPQSCGLEAPSLGFVIVRWPCRRRSRILERIAFRSPPSASDHTVISSTVRRHPRQKPVSESSWQTPMHGVEAIDVCDIGAFDLTEALWCSAEYTRLASTASLGFGNRRAVPSHRSRWGARNAAAQQGRLTIEPRPLRCTQSHSQL